MAFTPMEVLLLLALVYLIYRVHRLERLIEGGHRRRPARVPEGDGGKVIPILREQIEPGPFKPERK